MPFCPALTERPKFFHAQIYDTLVQQGKTQLQSGNAIDTLNNGQKAIAAHHPCESHTFTGGALMKPPSFSSCRGSES